MTAIFAEGMFFSSPLPPAGGMIISFQFIASRNEHCKGDVRGWGGLAMVGSAGR
jgi:hypothetical protein